MVFLVEMAEIYGLMFLQDFCRQFEEVLPPRTKRVRRREDPFDSYNDRDFFRRYRMSKEGVVRLNNLICYLLENPYNRGQPLSSIHQLLIALHYLGSSSYQRCTADRFQVSQFCSWRVTDCVLDAILTLE